MQNLLKAAWFAAEKHSQQRRKNTDQTPYINHPIEVAEYLSRMGGVTDEAVLIAALLHDTLEDTNTSENEIRDAFGDDVLSLVQECSDDKTLEKAERKHLQITTASKKSPGAKLIKLSDKICNLRSIMDDPPNGWSASRQLDYFRWAEQVVAGLSGVNERLDQEVNQIIQQGIVALSATDA